MPVGYYPLSEQCADEKKEEKTDLVFFQKLELPEHRFRVLLDCRNAVNVSDPLSFSEPRKMNKQNYLSGYRLDLEVSERAICIDMTPKTNETFETKSHKRPHWRVVTIS